MTWTWCSSRPVYQNILSVKKVKFRHVSNGIVLQSDHQLIPDMHLEHSRDYWFVLV